MSLKAATFPARVSATLLNRALLGTTTAYRSTIIKMPTTNGFATVSAAPRRENFVPNIDISPFLKDPHSAAASKVTEAARQACLTTGFFQLTGHGLPADVQKGLFESAQRFFSLPMDEKAKLDARNQLGRRGYDVLESETFHSDSLPDLKEGFYVGHELSLQDPPVRDKRFFMGPNAWPDLPPQEFKKPVQEYFNAVESLAVKVLDLIASTLPHGPNVFQNFTKGYVVAPLRLLHYPPPKVVEEGSKQHGAGAHTDFGAITLLLQDGNPGLEVMDNETNEFVPIQPVEGALVVNVGDMLSSWTGGEYKSSVHRVMNRHDAHRYSAAFFYNGSLDCPLDPLDGSKPAVADWTVEKHLIKRITDSYEAKG